MQKILLLILGTNILYYAGNIIYDLYFDKAKALSNQEDGQLVDMGGDHEENHVEESNVRHINAESVSYVELPNSADFHEDDLYDDETPTNYNADAIKKNYEEELQLEKYSFSPDQEKIALEKEVREKKQLAESMLASIKIPKENIVSSVVNVLDEDNFDLFLEKAKQHVVLVTNNLGHKTYKTTLSI